MSECVQVCMCAPHREGGGLEDVAGGYGMNSAWVSHDNSLGPTVSPDIHSSGPRELPVLATLFEQGAQFKVKTDEHVFTCHGAWCACWSPLSHTWSTLAASPDLCPCSAWPWWSVPAPTASPPPLLIGLQSHLMVSARLQGCSGQNNALFMSKQNTSDRANIFKLKSKA